MNLAYLARWTVGDLSLNFETSLECLLLSAVLFEGLSWREIVDVGTVFRT